MANQIDVLVPGDSIAKPAVISAGDSLSTKVLDEMINDHSKSMCAAAEAVIASGDLDKNGQLSFVEITNIYARQNGTSASDLGNQFKALDTLNRLDKNGDQQLSADELIEGLKPVQQQPDSIAIPAIDLEPPAPIEWPLPLHPSIIEPELPGPIDWPSNHWPKPIIDWAPSPVPIDPWFRPKGPGKDIDPGFTRPGSGIGSGTDIDPGFTVPGPAANIDPGFYKYQ